MTAYEQGWFDKAKAVVFGPDPERALAHHNRLLDRNDRQLNNELMKCDAMERAAKRRADAAYAKGNEFEARLESLKAGRMQARKQKLVAQRQAVYNEQIIGQDAVATHRIIENKRQASKHLKSANRMYSLSRTNDIVAHHEFEKDQLEHKNELVIPDVSEEECFDDVEVDASEFADKYMKQLAEQHAHALNTKLTMINVNGRPNGGAPPPNSRARVKEGVVDRDLEARFNKLQFQAPQNKNSGNKKE
jgi:hypothetical protein